MEFRKIRIDGDEATRLTDITNINNRKSLVYLAPMRPTSLDSLFPLVASPDKYAMEESKLILIYERRKRRRNSARQVSQIPVPTSTSRCCDTGIRGGS